MGFNAINKLIPKLFLNRFIAFTKMVPLKLLFNGILLLISRFIFLDLEKSKAS